LQPFFERAKQGEIAKIRYIKQAFEKRVGHEVDETTIQSLLNCYEWRKVMPRSFHPQADKIEQAEWHYARYLVIYENIRLISQPAYSLELNPVEHLWEELREKAFSNHAFESLDFQKGILECGLLLAIDAVFLPPPGLKNSTPRPKKLKNR
jgi:hypothetical protein